ncbi:TetR/AcrR family transcriptional regulator [Amycolatopsis rhabdoformis]|uniref:TetR/AcrR family transcriptional regulator n=1 Tax=Amycolatopsis rhabdoformis TaxID=1448059 RepID=A0ABZ1IL79_9PSEU|nr:TetR/AcrR family transcriptional regulator [Amycolatopsis rhabdoformis]WSE34487.1 TetR/AcrR family transcriptional regulator [Amycolatopsis rhabdoformis]
MTSTDERPDTGVPERVRAAIRSAGLSQRELAHRIGMDPTALSKALRGTRRLREEELAAIAKACAVSVRYLASGTGPAPVAAPDDGRRDRARPVSAQERRDQILEAATVLIARRGYHNVRVSDIAHYCGTSTATVHYHFPSKEATLHAALEFYARRFRERLDDEFGHASSAREKLRRLIDVQLPLNPDDVDEWSVWIQFWNQAMLEPGLRPAQRRIYSSWRALVVELLHECRSEGLAAGADIEALADRFTAMVDGLAIQILAGSTDLTPDRMRTLLRQAFEPHLTLT